VDGAAGQRHLPEHTDESSHSFILALNDDCEYDGGGTHFTKLGRTIRPPQGHLCLFPGGRLRHGGDPILSGTRYVFCYTIVISLILVCDG
jgi:hypothetical protein